MPRTLDTPPTAELPPEDDSETGVELAKDLLRKLQICEAAAELQEHGPEDSPAEFQEAMSRQLQALAAALDKLGGNPGLSGKDSLSSGSNNNAEVLLGVSVPMSPNAAAGSKKNGRNVSSSETRKRDVVEVNFDLDGQGRTVQATVEFYPDGNMDIHWSASNLPIPMASVVCFVQEIDLLSELAPFVVSSGVVHQFPWNDADRLVRVASKPPIPLVSGVEAVTQRFGFDLLDTPWTGFCFVECGPD